MLEGVARGIAHLALGALIAAPAGIATGVYVSNPSVGKFLHDAYYPPAKMNNNLGLQGEVPQSGVLGAGIITSEAGRFKVTQPPR